MVLVCAHLVRYPCPVSIGSPWNPGTVLGTLVYTQLGTGILLGLHYTPGIHTAYYSVIRIYREVWGGSGYRLLHSGGASMVFLLVLVHVYRGVGRRGGDIGVYKVMTVGRGRVYARACTYRVRGYRG